ncbi:hypothetical protein PHYSODRAFT_327778 [Phytophthora sojae]|uniref:RNase H type-1 domain-containing protein n=1 Tax=Phytophthora sojae (strain P6497) TaxID=1094619 RepID=G4Z6I7_PHYSP|nr:hypothetical protein PHYSODRAFT_327778 [Phytophthora sojae]EGZ19557.1 hypothetical protein PHYSODRAFT_327778 [Phytophthora sojae]|eukprot:XP_009522274.1 hypothetical protein PHYSODRAFT_327778 [Phytophthora sojae]
MTRYYAVVAGHCVGVYTDLDDALAMTRGYSHAKLKRFSTLGGAREFLNSHGLEIDYTHNPRHAIRNGQPDCHAAYACIFPHCQGAEVVGTVPQPWATSNRAEYLAAWIALVGANMVDADGTKVLYIYTDSMMLINSMTTWI